MPDVGTSSRHIMLLLLAPYRLDPADRGRHSDALFFLVSRSISPSPGGLIIAARYLPSRQQDGATHWRVLDLRVALTFPTVDPATLRSLSVSASRSGLAVRSMSDLPAKAPVPLGQWMVVMERKWIFVVVRRAPPAPFRRRPADPLELETPTSVLLSNLRRSVVR